MYYFNVTDSLKPEYIRRKLILGHELYPSARNRKVGKVDFVITRPDFDHTTSPVIGKISGHSFRVIATLYCWTDVYDLIAFAGIGQGPHYAPKGLSLSSHF